MRPGRLPTGTDSAFSYLHAIHDTEDSMSINDTLKGPASVKYYRSTDGRFLFKFAFAPEGDHIAIFCLSHPSLDGRDPSVHKTHLYSSGQVCFVAGREPRNEARAEALAKQWAEYFLEYRRTGVPQQ